MTDDGGAKNENEEVLTLRDEASGREWTGPAALVEKVRSEISAAEERRARWPKDVNAAMSQLAHSFPSLKGQPGTEPWNSLEFLHWLCGPAPGSGAVHAGRFVLGVWSPSTDWVVVAQEKGIGGAGAARRFDLFEALGTWDRAHVAACSAFMDAPFWP